MSYKKEVKNRMEDATIISAVRSTVGGITFVAGAAFAASAGGDIVDLLVVGGVLAIFAMTLFD